MGKLSTIGKGVSELEEAFKAAKVAKEKFPLSLTRAQPKTQQEITNMADRVARQQSGEHVTSGKPKDTKNIAGRSKKEAQRLQELQYTLEPTRELRPTPVYESKVGDVNMAIPGDQTVSDRRLLDVNGLPIESTQEGGSLYGEGKLHLDDPLFWASGTDVAQQFQNKVTNLANLYNTDDIMAHHLAMGPVSNNFAMHFADANLRAIANTEMTPEAVEEFNRVIRAGYVDNKGKHIPLPHFVGIENPEEAYLQMMQDSGLRKWFNNRMKVPSITKELGMPNGLDIQWAITEPELRNMEVNLTGHSVGKMKPGAELTDTADHMTYESGIQGESMGRAPELAPFELSFPDATMYVRGVQRPQDFTGTIQKVFPHQVVDQQHLDEMSKYYEELRRIRGFKKGGSSKLEKEFNQADVIGSNMVSPTATKTGEIIGSKALNELYDEIKRANPRMPLDVISNTVSGILGIPGDIASMMTSKAKPVMGKNVAGMIPTSEDIKGATTKAGITSGEEYPLIETAALGINPRSVVKGAKALEGLPAGMSIKDVSDAKKAVEFKSTLAKTVNNHKMEAMPGSQWSAWINANTPKSAKKEAEATGLHEWLKTQPKVSKYDIEEHLGENLPKVKVVEKGAPLKLTAEERDDLEGLTKKHSRVMHGVSDEPLTDDEYARLIKLSNIDEQATVQNLRHQAERTEKSAQQAQASGDKYTAHVNFNRAEHLSQRADQLELEPMQYGGSKFEKYTLPGGTNYKETMLNIPSKPMSFEEYTNYNMPGARDVEKYRPDYEEYLANPNKVSFKDNYHVPRAHTYDDPNTDVNRVAHMRMKDRMTLEGKKTLFLEELQSDWAQQGRDRGFKRKLTDLENEQLSQLDGQYKSLLKEQRQLADGYSDPSVSLEQSRAITDRYSQVQEELANVENERAKLNSLVNSSIPSGPYVEDTKDWTALGLKHALKRAVDEGHDVMAWTRGEQQAERYDLSKQVARIAYQPEIKGLEAYGHNGELLVNESNVAPEKIADYIGKEAADKLVNSPKQMGWHTMQGGDLQVGGEGMKAYYDQIVPSTMNDVLKQLGVSERVKPIDIHMERGAVGENHPDYGIPATSQHLGIEITPELREKVLNEGLPHFHEGGVASKAVKPTKHDKLSLNLEDEFRLANIVGTKPKK